MNTLSPRSRAHEVEIGKFVVEKFIQATDCNRIVAVVLTLRQAIKRADQTWERFTRREGEKLASELMKRVNADVLKTKYKRFNRRLATVCSLEGQTTGKRAHLNLAIEVPEWIDPIQMVQTVEKHAAALRWCSGRRSFYQPISVASELESWASYIVKEPGAVILDVCHF